MSIPGNENLEQWRPDLMRYAVLQLRDPQLAEDVVQETLLAGLEGLAKFTGKSSAKTWLTGILKHKIMDAIRRRSREQSRTADIEDESLGEAIDDLFTADGKWKQLPSNWGNPERAFENKKFWETFELCSKLMPERTAAVFMMHEVMEYTTDEICKELAITPTNIWVTLHRARLSLRQCLETKWFGGAAK